MRQVLEGIYRDISLAGSLGFKGGTAAMLFYDLPRFSVDLDFDLLVENADEKTWENLREKIKSIMAELGDVKKPILSVTPSFCCSPTAMRTTMLRLRFPNANPPF